MQSVRMNVGVMPCRQPKTLYNQPDKIHMQRIAVIDYGMGNLRSVSKAIEHVAPNDSVVVTSDADVIQAADRVVCPGQGAAMDCMLALRNHQLEDVIKEVVQSRPFLGICMGLQVLLTRSDENDGVKCLDVIPGQVRRFAAPLIDTNGTRLKVPHMGWSPVRREAAAHAAHPMWDGIEEHTRFYFAHSYFCVPDEPGCIAAYSDYGQAIAVALTQDSLFACQFHPEKSSAAGLRLLKNFVCWNGKA